MNVGARCNNDLLYVYAVAPANERGGIDGLATFAERVSAIPEGPFAAVVGESPGSQLNGGSREELARLLIAHQKVIEQLMRTTPVLPVKFGTQALPVDLRRALARGRPLFAEAFAKFTGTAELEVLVTWNLESVFADIASEAPIARLKAQLSGTVASPEDRETIGLLASQSLERRRATLAACVAEKLRAVAIDSIIHSVTSDRVVLHMALLLRNDAFAELDRCLERLDAQHGGRLGFRCVGPMAPASFATVELEFVDPDTIDRASRMLQVDPAAPLADLRSAYHRLARTVHPDTADDRDVDAQAMTTLSDAYKLLSHYALARDADSDASSATSPRSGGGAVLVSIRRQDGGAAATHA